MLAVRAASPGTLGAETRVLITALLTFRCSSGKTRALAHDVKLCKALGLLRSNDELQFRKNTDGVKVWEMTPKRATRMFDTRTDWNDPRAAISHVNNAFDPSVVNLCIG